MAAPFKTRIPAQGPNRALRRFLGREIVGLRPQIERSAAACGAERYRKHFDAVGHATLLLFHGLSGRRSLRQSYAAFGACGALAQRSGLQATPDAPLQVSYSQLAASNTTRPSAFLAGVLPPLLARVRQQEPHASVLPPTLQVLDSTFVRVSLALAPWLGLSRRTKRPGVSVQVQYTPALDLPEHVLITDAHTPDVRGLDQALLDDPVRLAALRDQTLVVDLGYYAHARFVRLLAAGVHLVTRRHPQATVVVTEDLPVQAPLPGLAPGRLTVQSDQRVRLGSTHNRTGAVLARMRLVRATVAPTPAAHRQGHAPVCYELLTDRFDLSAAEVVLLYLWRWQIELFFRWLKSHLRLPRLLGYSRAAVELSLWLVLLVHLLTVLAARVLGRRRRSPTLLAQCAVALLTLTPADLAALPAPPCQLPLPGCLPAP